jgi:hypothetical protein
MSRGPGIRLRRRRDKHQGERRRDDKQREADSRYQHAPRVTCHHTGPRSPAASQLERRRLIAAQDAMTRKVGK